MKKKNNSYRIILLLFIGLFFLNSPIHAVELGTLAQLSEKKPSAETETETETELKQEEAKKEEAKKEDSESRIEKSQLKKPERSYNFAPIYNDVDSALPKLKGDLDTLD